MEHRIYCEISFRYHLNTKNYKNKNHFLCKLKPLLIVASALPTGHINIVNCKTYRVNAVRAGAVEAVEVAVAKAAVAVSVADHSKLQ